MQAAAVLTVDIEAVVHLLFDYYYLNANVGSPTNQTEKQIELRKETKVHCLHATTAAERFFLALPSFRPTVQALGSAW